MSDLPRELSASEAESARPTTDCPYCGESILAVAVKCKHCGEFLFKDRASATTGVTRYPPDGGDPTSGDAPAAVPEPSQATPSPALSGSLPSTSMDRADSVFENFSVSGFSRGSKPASYVEAADGPAAVRSAQRRMMTQQLDRLSAVGTPGEGITLAVPESEVTTLLPSLDATNGTVELTDVLNIVAQYMRGTEFYATGHPVLNRLAVQRRATELIAALKDEAAPDDETVESRQEGATT